VTEEIVAERGTTLVRRLRLAPGEAMPWHTDPHHRVSVVLSGDELSIEFRDSGRAERVSIRAGLAGWDEPSERVHRAVNTGAQPYEEVTVFFLDKPGAPPQRLAD
jgi:hypothetical protein